MSALDDADQKARGEQFDIAHDLWQECWFAATASARSKKRAVGWDIASRVGVFLSRHGPQTESPLTLRVYGTMLKGFSALNNERSRSLNIDGEKALLLFTRQVECEDGGQQQGGTKRKQIQAVSLSLDLSKVKETDLLDWAPHEGEGSLLCLVAEDAGTLVPLVGAPDGGLPAQAALLLDEAFPAIDVPPTAPLDFERVTPARDLMVASAVMMAPLQDAPRELVEADALVPAQTSVPRHLSRRLLEAPGRVFGFDDATAMPETTRYNQMRDLRDEDITNGVLDPAGHATRLGPAGGGDGHFARLSVLLRWSGRRVSLPAAGEPTAAAGAGSFPVPDTSGWLEVQGTQPFGAAADPFRPYEPPVPLLATQGADADLAGALSLAGAPPQAEEQSPERKGGKKRARETPYDEQTAQVGSVLKRYVASASGALRAVTVDDLLPPGSTEKATAARTFAALLTLATAGEVRPEQHDCYGPIGLAVVG